MSTRDLYTYRINKREDDLIQAGISMNASHPVYKGHFPGHPITPGVIQVQMIREILEAERGIALQLTAARQIKFTAVHEPGPEPEIDAEISFNQQGGLLKVSARLYRNEIVYLRFKGEFGKQK